MFFVISKFYVLKILLRVSLAFKKINPKILVAHRLLSLLLELLEGGGLGRCSAHHRRLLRMQSAARRRHLLVMVVGRGVEKLRILQFLLFQNFLN